MESLLAELRRAVRTAGRQPAVTVPALLILALGIGSNAALFSVVSAALWRPAPYPQPEELVDLQAARREAPDSRHGLAPADFLAWKEGSTAFQHLGAYQTLDTVDLTGEGEPLRLHCHRMSEGLLAALRPTPAAGRLFHPQEYQPGGEPASPCA